MKWTAGTRALACLGTLSAGDTYQMGPQEHRESGSAEGPFRFWGYPRIPGTCSCVLQAGHVKIGPPMVPPLIAPSP